MFILSIMLPKLSIPDVPFPAPLSIVIKSQFQAMPATLLIPIDRFLSLSVGGVLRNRYQSDSFP